MKYKIWLEEWLENTVKPTVKSRTYDKYGRIIRTMILPSLGEYELSELSAQTLQSYVAALTVKYSANTSIGVIMILRGSLDTACNFGIIERHYACCISRPKIREKPIECFSVGEQKAIEHYITRSSKDKLFGIVLCMYTGLRISELLALTWNDIDFGQNLISITKSCYDSWDHGKYVKVYDTPKTADSLRVIPLPKQLSDKLKAIKKRSKCADVVNAKPEEQISIRSYQRTFDLLLKRLKIAHKGFHALRHTFATRAIECGMDVKTLSELLGHKNPTVTLARYTHSLLEHKTAMMNKLGKLFE